MNKNEIKDNWRSGSIKEWDSCWSLKNSYPYIEDLSLISRKRDLDEYVKFKYMEKIMPINKNILSLECGCGSAGVSIYFAKRGWNTIILDASEKALKIAKENFLKEGVKEISICGNIESLCFKDNSFDIVMSFGVLEHFEDPGIVISEMVRILKHGGIFFSDIVPRKFSLKWVDILLNYIFFIFANIIKLRFKKLVRIKVWLRPDYYENSLSIKQYEKLLISAGLKNVKVKGARPFPNISLLSKFRNGEKIYINILKKLLPFWNYFDTSNSRLSDILGIILFAYGVKK